MGREYQISNSARNRKQNKNKTILEYSDRIRDIGGRLITACMSEVDNFLDAELTALEMKITKRFIRGLKQEIQIYMKT